MRKFAPLRYSLQFLRQSLYCRNNYPHCSASRFGCRYGYSYCLSIRNTLHSLAVLLRISTGSHPRRSDYNRKEPLLRFSMRLSLPRIPKGQHLRLFRSLHLWKPLWDNPNLSVRGRQHLSGFHPRRWIWYCLRFLPAAGRNMFCRRTIRSYPS